MRLFLFVFSLMLASASLSEAQEVDDTMLLWCSHIEQNNADVLFEFTLKSIAPPSEHNRLSRWREGRAVARAFDFYRITGKHSGLFHHERMQKFGSVKEALSACNKKTLSK